MPPPFRRPAPTQAHDAVAQPRDTVDVDVDTTPVDGIGNRAIAQALTAEPDEEAADHDVEVDVGGTVPIIWFQRNSVRIRRDALVDSSVHLADAISAVRGHLAVVGDTGRVVLHGFASVEGTEPDNRALAAARADRVRDLFVAAGLPRERIVTVAHGEDRTFPGRSWNRRVELELQPTVTDMRFPAETVEARPSALLQRGNVEPEVPAGAAPAFEPSPTVDVAIHIGGNKIELLDETTLAEASPAQRLVMIKALVDATWTGDSEEVAIIRIVRTTPQAQAKGLLIGLSKQMTQDETYLGAMDRDVDLGNNLALHDALSDLRMRARGAEFAASAILSAPVLPWHDVMGFFEDAAVFSVERRANGKVRMKYPWHVRTSKDMAEEVQKLDLAMFIGGVDYDADQLLVIHDYDRGRNFPVMAAELAGYQASGVRGFLSHVATVASLGVPLSAARTVGGKIAVVTLERILPATLALVNENRLNLVKWFPRWGPRMLYFADIVGWGVSLYGLGAFARSGWRTFRSWRETRKARSSMDPAPFDREGEQLANAIETEADRMFDAVDDLNASDATTGPPHGTAGPRRGGDEPGGEHLSGGEGNRATGAVDDTASAPPERVGEPPPPDRLPSGAKAVTVTAADFPFASGKDLPVPDRPDRLYRIMSNEEAAATLRTGKLQATGGEPGQMPHKFLSMNSKYPALFKPEALRKADEVARAAAGAEAAGDAARASQLRDQAAGMIEQWHSSPGQTVIVAIELEGGSLEAMLRRSIDEQRRAGQAGVKAFTGQDIFIYKKEGGNHNLAVPWWQIDRFNKYIKGVQLHGWRAPFGPGFIPRGPQ